MPITVEHLQQLKQADVVLAHWGPDQTDAMLIKGAAVCKEVIRTGQERKQTLAVIMVQSRTEAEALMAALDGKAN